MNLDNNANTNQNNGMDIFNFQPDTPVVASDTPDVSTPNVPATPAVAPVEPQPSVSQLKCNHRLQLVQKPHR